MSRELFSPLLNAKELPPELVRELKLSNDVESQILEVFKEGGGILNVGEVLVGFYKLHEKIDTRRHMTTILYRMKSKGLLYATGKKGEYSTSSP